MNALNTKTKSVKMNWASITFPLLQGTPIGADGTIQNDEDAIGLVMETIKARPLLANLDILIAGDVDKSEIVYSSISDEAIKAMSGISFFNSDGSKESSGGSGGSAYKTVDIYYWAGSGEDTDVPQSWMGKTQIQYEEGWTWADVIGSFNNPVIGCFYGAMTSLLYADTVHHEIYYNIMTNWGGTEPNLLWVGENSDEAEHVSDEDEINSENTYFFYKYLDPECLKAGTQIAIEGATIDVMDIKEGQEVLTLDTETLKVKTAKVNEVKLDITPEERKIADRWYKYKFDDGSEIHLVGRHRFWNVEKNKFEWMHKWEIGDHAFKIDGSSPAYIGMETVEEKTEWNTFWNEGKANYFANGFLSGNITSPVPNFKVKR